MRLMDFEKMEKMENEKIRILAGVEIFISIKNFQKAT